MKTIVLLALLLPAVPAAQQALPPDTLRDAGAALDAGDLPTAIPLYREFLKEYPDAAEIRSNLGAALARSGQFAEAIREYQAALEKMPRNSRVRVNLALAYFKLGQMTEAARELEVLHAAQPLELKPALLLADCYIESGQAGKAVELLTPVQQEYPDDHAVIYSLGMALLQDNQVEHAQAMLDRILRDGQSVESEFLLGQAEFLRQNNVAAAEHLARAVQLNPDLPGVHSLFATVLRQVGKPEQAEQEFAEELKRNPYDFAANLETAMQRKQDGRLDQALVHIQRALQVRPADPGALYQQASIHLAQGHAEQARREFEQLVRKYPEFSEAHAGLATVYYRLKRKEDGDRERAAARRVQDEAQKRLEQRRATAPPR